jgi:hypothetical protein
MFMKVVYDDVALRNPLRSPREPTIMAADGTD